MISKAILEERLETRLLITYAQGVLERARAAEADADAILASAEADLAERRLAPVAQTVAAPELLRLYHRWRHLGASPDFVEASQHTFRQCADELDALMFTAMR